MARRYTGYAYRLPDWIIDTTHRVRAPLPTPTHPGAPQKVSVSPGAVRTHLALIKRAVPSVLQLSSLSLSLSLSLSHTHTQSHTLTFAPVPAPVCAQSNSDWKSARNKWFNELLGFCDGFNFNGLDIVEDKVSVLFFCFCSVPGSGAGVSTV